MLEQCACFPIVPVRRRNETLANPGKGIIRIECLCLVKCFIRQLDVFVVEIEHPKASPSRRILETKQSDSARLKLRENAYLSICLYRANVGMLTERRLR